MYSNKGTIQNLLHGTSDGWGPRSQKDVLLSYTLLTWCICYVAIIKLGLEQDEIIRSVRKRAPQVLHNSLFWHPSCFMILYFGGDFRLIYFALKVMEPTNMIVVVNDSSLTTGVWLHYDCLGRIENIYVSTKVQREYFGQPAWLITAC